MTWIEAATEGVSICGYCGCVYTAVSHRIFGWKENGVAAKAWLSNTKS
jgi:hypothetical protein